MRKIRNLFIYTHLIGMGRLFFMQMLMSTANSLDLTKEHSKSKRIAGSSVIRQAHYPYKVDILVLYDMRLKDIYKSHSSAHEAIKEVFKPIFDFPACLQFAAYLEINHIFHLDLDLNIGGTIQDAHKLVNNELPKYGNKSSHDISIVLTGINYRDVEPYNEPIILTGGNYCTNQVALIYYDDTGKWKDYVWWMFGRFLRMENDEYPNCPCDEGRCIDRDPKHLRFDLCTQELINNKTEMQANLRLLGCLDTEKHYEWKDPPICGNGKIDEDEECDCDFDSDPYTCDDCEMKNCVKIHTNFTTTTSTELPETTPASDDTSRIILRYALVILATLLGVAAFFVCFIVYSKFSHKAPEEQDGKEKSIKETDGNGFDEGSKSEYATMADQLSQYFS